MLPVVLAYFRKEEVGTWFVFLTLSSLSLVFSMALGPNVSRNSAYIIGGAKNLKSIGLEQGRLIQSEVDLNLFTRLVGTSRTMYTYIALGLILLLLLPGTFYILSLRAEGQTSRTLISAWVFFAMGTVLAVSSTGMDSILRGTGHVEMANRVVIVSKGCFIFLGCGLVILGKDLIGLSLAFLLSNLFGVAISMNFCRKVLRKYLVEMPKWSLRSDKEMLEILWPNTFRLGFVLAGGFLISRSTILVASTTLGVGEVANYSLSLSLFFAVNGLAMTMTQNQMPQINRLQIQHNISGARTLYLKMLKHAWITYVLAISFAALISNLALDSIGSESRFLGASAMLLLTLIFFLELNHSVAATYLTSLNSIVFARASLISGVVILVGSSFAVLEFGVVGIILTQGIVQASYNNWKWPREAAAHLNITVGSLLSAMLWRK